MASVNGDSADIKDAI